MPKNDHEALYVATPKDLASLCDTLDGVRWLAVDTEFQREKTYYPQLCLIQVATEGLVACVDPLVDLDLAPFLQLLRRPEIVKVFHAARQDLEIFFHLTGATLGPIFDTQIAAPLLGHPEQVGYSSLVERVLNVRLPKAYTRADWTQRPLPGEQLDYARDDVRYLAQLYLCMQRELAARGRFEWLAEDFEALGDPELYDQPPARAWKRLGGVDRLEGARLAIVQELAAWRELTARADNIPRNWVLRDEALLDIAAMAPLTVDALLRIRGIAERSVRRYGAKIIHTVQQAKTHTPQPLDVERRPLRLNPAQEALVDCLSAVIRLRAHEQAVAPTILATRKDLERLVAGERDLPICKGWRANVVWQALEAFLEGHSSLGVRQSVLALSETEH